MGTRYRELITRKQKLNALIDDIQKEDKSFNSQQAEKRDKANLKLVNELIGGKPVNAKELSNRGKNDTRSDLSRLKPLLLIELDRADAEIRIINKWRNSKKAELYARNFKELGDPTELAEQAVKLLARVALIHKSIYNLKAMQVNDLGFLLNRYSDKATHPGEIMKIAESLNNGINEEIRKLEEEGTQVPTGEREPADPPATQDEKQIKPTESKSLTDKTEKAKEPQKQPKVKADTAESVNDKQIEDHTHDLTLTEEN